MGFCFGMRNGKGEAKIWAVVDCLDFKFVYLSLSMNFSSFIFTNLDLQTIERDQNYSD